MSSSMDISGKKPSFSQTCSRLSRYLKEKGSFGDLSLGITCKPDVNGDVAVSRQPTMMNLFPCEAPSGMKTSADQNIEPKNMFHRESSFSSSSTSGTKEEVQIIKLTKSVKPESQSAPLTIFYGGRVMVFDDYSAEKAKEVIDLAIKGSAKSVTAEVNQSGYTQNLTNNQKEIAPNTTLVRSPIKPVAQEPVQPTKSSLACELPIARRASLHRFLEKRKDRITSKAPYQIDCSAEASSKLNPSWRGSH